jgi:rubredoxin
MAGLYRVNRFLFSGADPGVSRTGGFIDYFDVYNNASFTQWELQMAYKKWVCVVCGYQYDEELGDPDHGIAAGTAWEDVPDDWECPECGASKADFEMEQAA